MCFMVSRLTEWNGVAGIVTFPKAPQKHGAKAGEGEEAAVRTGLTQAASDATSQSRDARRR